MDVISFAVFVLFCAIAIAAVALVVGYRFGKSDVTSNFDYVNISGLKQNEQDWIRNRIEVNHDPKHEIEEEER